MTSSGSKVFNYKRDARQKDPLDHSTQFALPTDDGGEEWIAVVRRMSLPSSKDLPWAVVDQRTQTVVGVAATLEDGEARAVRYLEAMGFENGHRVEVDYAQLERHVVAGLGATDGFDLHELAKSGFVEVTDSTPSAAKTYFVVKTSTSTLFVESPEVFDTSAQRLRRIAEVVPCGLGGAWRVRGDDRLDAEKATREEAEASAREGAEALGYGEAKLFDKPVSVQRSLVARALDAKLVQRFTLTGRVLRGSSEPVKLTPVAEAPPERDYEANPVPVVRVAHDDSNDTIIEHDYGANGVLRFTPRDLQSVVNDLAELGRIYACEYVVNNFGQGIEEALSVKARGPVWIVKGAKVGFALSVEQLKGLRGLIDKALAEPAPPPISAPLAMMAAKEYASRVLEVVSGIRLEECLHPWPGLEEAREKLERDLGGGGEDRARTILGLARKIADEREAQGAHYLDDGADCSCLDDAGLEPTMTAEDHAAVESKHWEELYAALGLQPNNTEPLAADDEDEAQAPKEEP